MRILFYSDIEVFGGHEVTVLDAIEGAETLPDVDIGVAYCKRNRMFGDHIEKRFGSSARIEKLPHDFFHEKGDLFRAFIPIGKRSDIAAFIKAWKPDAVIVCQGHMGVSICGLAAAVDSKSLVISYLPMAHTLRDMTGKVSLTICAADALLDRAYQWPSLYLVSNSGAADQLQCKHNVDNGRIRVIEYGPDLEQLRPVSRSEARSELGLGGGFYVGIVARIDLRQKGHDIVLDAVKRHGGLPGNILLLIVGDGPDEQRVKSFVKDHHLEKCIKFLPYIGDISSVYSALDALLIPSRYEGVPIVMLQAMFFKLPVIAADVDGMKTILPDEWRFTPRSCDHLMAALERILDGIDPDLLERNKNLVEKTWNAARFRERFGAFVEHLRISCHAPS
jgi:glycosyltransferase involved in cell wall biosynthesis